MVKNNKGFTLIELLAIVVILAIIMVIAAPSMTKEIRRSEEENQNILNKKIDNAAHLYAAKYYANKLIAGEEFTFTLNDLLDDGLIRFNNGVCDESESIRNEEIKVYRTDDRVEYDYTSISNNNTNYNTNDCYIISE